MFNRGPNYSGGEKKLYQQKKRTHEHMKKSSKILTEKLEKNKMLYITFNVCCICFYIFVPEISFCYLTLLCFVLNIIPVKSFCALSFYREFC